MFRRYDGLKLLYDLFKIHKDLHIANALAHAIDPRYSNYISLTILLQSLSTLGLNTFDWIKNIGDTVGEILMESAQDEGTIEDSLDFLNILVAKNVPISWNEVSLRAFSTTITRFIENEEICLKGLMFLSSITSSKKGKKERKNPQQKIHVIFSFLEISLDNECYESGAISAIMQAMKKYTLDPAICEFALRTFRWMLPNIEGKENISY